MALIVSMKLLSYICSAVLCKRNTEIHAITAETLNFNLKKVTVVIAILTHMF